MNKRNSVIITISTFRGISSNAIHYYGQIEVYDEHYNYDSSKLERPITEEEIKKYPDRFYSYNVGDLTKCFNTWKDVVLTGKEFAIKNYPDKRIIVEGIPNVKSCTIEEALDSELDTRAKCKMCSKVFKAGEGCYNMGGLVCMICYNKYYK